MAKILEYTFDDNQKIETPKAFTRLSLNQTQMIDDCLDEYIPNDEA
ncbi:MAG: hypothetical protein NTZ67_02855 [Gammaproteobacteria bacterium]|nr:hypothetical protein [Gammaproteobacteria bacterium]